MLKKSIMVILLLPLLAGCYTPPKQMEFDKSITIDKSYDDAWANAVRWFAEKNFNIQALEKASGLITTDFSIYRDGLAYIDCGEGGVYDYPSMKINALLTKKNENQTSATMNMASKTMANIGGLSRMQVDCVSNGKLEAEFFNALRQSNN